VVIGAMLPVTDSAQVMRFGGLGVAGGATLGTTSGAFGWIGGGACRATLGTAGGVVIAFSGNGNGE
jgi:hypothetical protein